jgi:hypothetical protein
MNDRELLERYAPELRFTAQETIGDEQYPAEAFFPMDVKEYVKECSLHISYRLFGLIRLRTMEQKGPRADGLATISSGHPGWDWLARLPIISKVVSLRYVQPDDLEQVPEADQDDEMEWNTEAGCGCGCLSFILSLALLALALVSLLSWQQAVLLIVGLMLMTGIVIVPRGLWSLGFAFLILATIPLCYWQLSLALGRGHRLFGLCFGSWFLPSLLVAVTGLLTQKNDTLRNFLNALSSLDDRTGQAARIKFEEKARVPPFKVYGRVIRPRGASHWHCALQYWFFYPMNDWRTGHGGLNDHEGDWEQVTVFLPAEPLAETRVGYSQHYGKVVRPLYGPRPIVYVGVGSHANYPSRGQHPLLMMLLTVLRRYPKQFLPRLRSTARAAGQGVGVQIETTVGRVVPKKVGTRLEGMTSQVFKTPPDARARFDAPVRQWGQEVYKGDRPIVDRATGDHPTMQLRPDQNDWDLEIIGEATPWAQYKGHWGRWVLSPGERGPGGPMYSQGKVRPAWRDPFRWAGLPA